MLVIVRKYIPAGILLTLICPTTSDSLAGPTDFLISWSSKPTDFYVQSKQIILKPAQDWKDKLNSICVGPVDQWWFNH